MRYWPTAQSSPPSPACCASAKIFGQIVGKAQTRVPAGGGLAQQAQVLRAQRNRGSGMLGRMQHHFAIGRVERRLKQRAVDGFKECLRRDPLRLSVNKCLR